MFTIRKATDEDLPLIRNVAAIAFPAAYRKILTPAQIDYMMEWMYSLPSLYKQVTEENHIYYIAFREAKAVGYVSIQQENEALFHLQKIYILPEAQGYGLGRQLFTYVLQRIREIHPAPCSLELNVNRRNPAIGFYEKMGLSRLREGDFDIGGGYFMNDYIMGMEI